MLSKICHDLRNYFETSKHYGNYKIEDGVISPLDFVMPNQYFRIMGSVFNDGVYKNPAKGLADEDFSGAIWAMAVPKELVELSEKIDEYCEKQEEEGFSPYVSESYDKYSYTIGLKDGLPVSWRDVFAHELRRWQKI